MKTKGNTVLITGGASGIGLALARALADNDQVKALYAMSRLAPSLAERLLRNGQEQPGT